MNPPLPQPISEPNLKMLGLAHHHFHAPARLLMSILFLLSGISKLGAVEETQKYMEAYGVPGYLIYPAAALEITGGSLLLIGLYTHPLSVVLAGWCLLTAFIFHTEFTDQTQLIMMLKNLAMAGGFLILSDHGAPGMSVDGGYFSKGKIE